MAQRIKRQSDWDLVQIDLFCDEITRRWGVGWGMLTREHQQIIAQAQVTRILMGQPRGSTFSGDDVRALWLDIAGRLGIRDSDEEES